MNRSFYASSVAAGAHQERLDIIANNVANINTNGYKALSAKFVDLLYENMNAPAGEESAMKSGSGTRVEKTDIDFLQGALQETNNPLDFALKGDSFFALLNPESQEVRYTRSGSFSMSEYDGAFYLRAQNGDFVLDPNFQPITLWQQEQELNVGVFRFTNKEGFSCVGDNLYVPDMKNGAPFSAGGDSYMRGYLESSNVDLAGQMTKLIETQRAYQFSLRMIQAFDEVKQIINNLR